MDRVSTVGTAHDAGRKSGLWQGAAEVGLQELEKQWDDVKVCGKRSMLHSDMHVTRQSPFAGGPCPACQKSRPSQRTSSPWGLPL